GAHPLEKAFIQLLGFTHHQPVADVNASLLQTVKSTPSDLRVRILHRGNHARYASGDECVTARWRTTMMATGFECDIGGRTFGFFTRHTQRVYFGMWFTRTLVVTFTDNFAIFDNDAPDIRVGMRGKTSSLRQL